MKQIVKIFLFIGFHLACFGFLSAQVEVDSELQFALSNGDTIGFFAYFKEQTSVEDIPYEMDKASKNVQVFERLYQSHQSSQKNVIGKLDSLGVQYVPYYIVNTIWIKGDSTVINALAGYDEILSFLPNHRIQVPTDMSPMSRSIEAHTRNWGIDFVQADLVWKMGITGEGVVVGGQDTGYEWDHPALKENYRGYTGDSVSHDHNWFDAIFEINPLNGQLNPDSTICGINNPIPCDDNGHGSHTMGTMIGHYPTDTIPDTIGMAPGAKWIGVRNMDRGHGSVATYLKAMEWFLAPTDVYGNNPDPTKAPDVINNSWACPLNEGCNLSNLFILEHAVNHLDAAGILVVVSAGNSGRNPNCVSVISPPAIFEKSYTVGAFNSAGSIAAFSSRGQNPTFADVSLTKPDITAPGVGIYSARRNGNFGNSSGTSMAGPHVAGLVALIISANPDLRGKTSDIKRIINETASPAYDPVCDTSGLFKSTTYGYGKIHAYAAVLEALQTTKVHDDKVNSNMRFLKIYPNPVESQFIIESQYDGEQIIQVFNLNGQQINNIIITKGLNQINVNNWPSGLLILKNNQEICKIFVK